MKTIQKTLGFDGFAPEEAPSTARIEMRHFAAGGQRLRGVEIRGGRLTGHDSGNTEHQVKRSIAYNLDGSRHRCNSSCQHAKGKHCECSCGGANHGKGLLTGTRLFNFA
jgi:hypothetical protein